MPKKSKKITKPTKPKAKVTKGSKKITPEIGAAIADLAQKASNLGEWADAVFNKPEPVPELPSTVHAADKVDIDNIPLEELMELAGRECSCRRLQRAQGVERPACTGFCSHAKALEELTVRGIVV